ncbi:MAG: MBL fold metallo-hydrolase [Bacillota bacterium]|nr:MBL fold metallo-hydrolase [Bacillota bacterium]
MEITWFGHSCFLFKDRSGKKLLTDPFDTSVGYSVPNETVDIVTVSHQHFDHNYVEALPGIPAVIDKTGSFCVNDISIKGIQSYHDKYKGAKRGNNIIFVINMDGLTVCHMGDIGHMPAPEDFQEIGDIDVLFIPVGGNYTIDGEEAAKVSRQINSHIVIPMHYRTSALSLPLEGTEKFIMKMGNSEKVGSSTLVLEGSLEGFNKVKILDYKSQL